MDDKSKGKNAILIPVSYKIGSAKDIEIRDIGYEYSVDKTISPFVRFAGFLSAVNSQKC